MPTISIHTLGCKVNQYESQAILEQFLNNGYTEAKENSADVIVINSCTVTAESDRKTRQLLNRQRRINPNSTIILTGCMVQAFPQKSAENLGADIIVGNTDTHRIFDILTDFLNNKTTNFQIFPHQNDELFSPISINSFSERTRAFMKIEDGCDRYCTYCIIPFARGRVRSRSIEDISKEAERLARSGFAEIVLVGINLSSFGKDNGLNLCDAVDAASMPDGIKRVRLGSLEPDLITDDMLRRLSCNEKFCPQFHLSLQSGCDATLKRMNRHYDSDFYYDLVERIRKAFKNPSITTDIMVGFAGETEEEFEKSLEFVKKVGFAKAHIFCYSRREGTVAAALKSQITNKEKQTRSKIMAAVSEKNENDFLASQIGKCEYVLFETAENGCFVGYTPNYTKVSVKTDENLNGRILKVRLLELGNNGCIGNII
ncbi:MAG: tRNA (N(6)-L-threonylcarbamoyladenosine(37)-C(2))-methylthiotransferase MtaB [Oscillospiraceae bacterium]|nr:tRNA (N(6)-L-threonylcarbamoyladenosine(37)-C(2))-methylthiotransferase MtaB [Oscillospiraceae bacterium]